MSQLTDRIGLEAELRKKVDAAWQKWFRANGLSGDGALVVQDLLMQERDSEVPPGWSVVHHQGEWFVFESEYLIRVLSDIVLGLDSLLEPFGDVIRHVVFEVLWDQNVPFRTIDGDNWTEALSLLAERMGESSDPTALVHEVVTSMVMGNYWPEGL